MLSAHTRKAKRSLLNVDAYQTGGTFPRHESAGPAVAGIKNLLVTPKHLQLRTGRFLPANLIISVPLPRRRLTGHEIEIKLCRPTENAVARSKEGLITWRRHSSETLAGILGGGCQPTESENHSAARQCKLIDLGRANSNRQ